MSGAIRYSRARVRVLAFAFAYVARLARAVPCLASPPFLDAPPQAIIKPSKEMSTYAREYLYDPIAARSAPGAQVTTILTIDRLLE